jgi:hypothetical protein
MPSLPLTRDELIDLLRKGKRRRGHPGRYLTDGHRDSDYIDFECEGEPYHAEYFPPARCGMLRSLGAVARWAIWRGPSTSFRGKAWSAICEAPHLDVFPEVRCYSSHPA